MRNHFWRQKEVTVETDVHLMVDKVRDIRVEVKDHSRLPIAMLTIEVAHARVTISGPRQVLRVLTGELMRCVDDLPEKVPEE